MKWSLRIGSIAGTEIRLHITLILLVPLVLYRYRTVQEALTGFLLVVAIFVCIVLHELGHTLAARYYGIQVKNITLWPMGGFANLSRQPEKPLPTLLIAAAGPVVNILLAILLFTIAVMLMVARVLTIPALGIGLLQTSGLLNILVVLTLANLSLAIFNLFPIFPLDGGRIARAGLEMLFGPRRADTILIFISLPLAALVALIAILTGDILLFLVSLLLILGSTTLSQRLLRWMNLGLAALVNRPVYYLLKNDPDPAIESLTQAIQHQPNQALLYINRAVAYLYLGEYMNAGADLERALALNPVQPYAFLYRGILEYLLGQKEQALEWYERAIRLRPEWALAYANRGGIFQDLGDLPRALADLNHAIELEPHLPLLYMLRSIVRHQSGDQEGSRTDAKVAIQHPSEDTLVFNELSLVNMKGNLEWALAYYGWAIEQMPGSSLPYQGRADASRINRQFDQAIEDYTRALKLDPGNAELYLGRGQCYQERFDVAGAASDYQRAVELASRSHLKRKARSLLDKIQSSS